MPPTEHDADESGPYAEAIGQLMAAAERTRDPEAWLTLTALTEMFVRLDQRHRASAPAGCADLDRRYPPPAADKSG
jgi:hypothetical protein